MSQTHSGTAPSVVTTQLGDQEGLRECVCGALFEPVRWNQRFCRPSCCDRAYNRQHPVSRQASLDFNPPTRPVIPVHDQRLARQLEKWRKRSLGEQASWVYRRMLDDGPVANCELAHVFLQRWGALAAGAFRTRLSDVTCWLRAHPEMHLKVESHDAGYGIVWHWIEEA